MFFTFFVPCQLANSRTHVSASLFLHCTSQKSVLPCCYDVLFSVQSLSVALSDTSLREISPLLYDKDTDPTKFAKVTL